MATRLTTLRLRPIFAVTRPILSDRLLNNNRNNRKKHGYKHKLQLVDYCVYSTCIT